MPLTATTIETKIALPYAEIDHLCRRLGVAELAVFGSVLRDDFRAESDIDFLVTFTGNDCGPWGSKLMLLSEDLERLIGRPVDVVTRKAVEDSPNYIRRRHILDSARTIYVA